MKTPEPSKESPLARFFNHATEEERRRVFKDVIERSIEAQNAVLKEAEAIIAAKKSSQET
jgi:hypothetical protein